MQRAKVLLCLPILIATLSITRPLRAEVLERASGETLSAAVGHYARARSLLIEAINEFDRGQKMADPSALLDTKQWRDSLIERSHDLDRVVDPQPRASNSGVTFNPDKRLLNEAKD